MYPCRDFRACTVFGTMCIDFKRLRQFERNFFLPQIVHLAFARGHKNSFQVLGHVLRVCVSVFF